MAEYIRKAFMIPRKVREALDGQFSAETQLEVIYAIDDYARHWDVYRCDDGFDVQYLSPLAKMAFLMVLSEVREHNANYIHRSTVNTENAIVGAEKRQENEIKNAKRRENYAFKKQLSASCQRKNLSLGGVTKSVTKVANKALADKDLRESQPSPIGLLVTGNSFHSLPVVTEERGCGGKHFIHKATGDNSANNDPTSGLSGSNLKVCAGKGDVSTSLDMTREKVGVIRVGGGTVKGNKDGGSKAISSKKAVGNKAEIVTSQDAPRNDRLRDKGGIKEGSDRLGDSATVNSKFGKDGLCRGSADNLKPKNLMRESKGDVSTALDMTRNGGRDNMVSMDNAEIVIAANFHIDFLDPAFVQYNRADDFLIKGVEDWLIEHKLGRSIEKKWIAKQIWKFACNQGKANLLLGIDDEG